MSSGLVLLGEGHCLGDGSQNLTLRIAKKIVSSTTKHPKIFHEVIFAAHNKSTCSLPCFRSQFPSPACFLNQEDKTRARQGSNLVPGSSNCVFSLITKTIYRIFRGRKLSIRGEATCSGSHSSCQAAGASVLKSQGHQHHFPTTPAVISQIFSFKCTQLLKIWDLFKRKLFVMTVNEKPASLTVSRN